MSAIRRGLAAEPSKRWPSVGVLLDELQRGRARVRRRQVGAVLAGLGVVAAGALGVRHFDQQQRIAACEAAGAAMSRGRGV